MTVGLRVGVSVGLRVGLAVGVSADETSPGSAGGNPMAGVTQDATSGIYWPSSAAEWTITMAAAGLSTGNPGSLWNMQEAAGNLADSIGTVTLTQSGAGHLYLQTVTGWTRKAVQGVDGTAAQKWINSTTANNPATTDTLILAYVGVPAAAPGAPRCLFGKNATGYDFRFNTTGKLRVVFGASADLTVDNRNTVIPVIVKVDNTNTISAVYTSTEKFIGTYGLPGSGTVTYFGGQTKFASAAQFLGAAEFVGAAARLTDAQVKTLLQTLNWTIPWT